jgi:hypothetical protein
MQPIMPRAVAPNRDSGGSVCESNTPKTSQGCLAPVLKTGRITGSHALPRVAIIREGLEPRVSMLSGTGLYPLSTSSLLPYPVGI